MILPKVSRFLSPQEMSQAVFLRPAIGKELETFFTVNDNMSFLAGVLSVRLMTLAPNTVVPFHVHKRKEKVYIPQGPEVLSVATVTSGNVRLFELERGRPFLIPAGTPHFVKFFSAEVTPCSTLVVSSSQDAADIQWEDGVEGLISR